jgi:hypothetical protein
MSHNKNSRLAEIQARVRNVKKVLGPGSDTAAIEAAVCTVVVLEERRRRRADILRRPVTGDDWDAIDRVAKAAHRLLTTLNNEQCPNFVVRLFPGLSKHVAYLEELVKKPPAKPKRSAENKRRAAEQAAALIKHHGLKPKTTRGKTFDLVAAALSGDKDASLFDHIRKYRTVSFD